MAGGRRCFERGLKALNHGAGIELACDDTKPAIGELAGGAATRGCVEVGQRIAECPLQRAPLIAGQPLSQMVPALDLDEAEPAGWQGMKRLLGHALEVALPRHRPQLPTISARRNRERAD